MLNLGGRVPVAVGALALLISSLVAPAAQASQDDRVTEAPTAAPRANTFPERFSVNAAGDLVITGNTLMTCPDSDKNCAQARTGAGTSSMYSNNSYSMVMVDIDTDPTTLNSSSADLLIPRGAPVLFAGLYWGSGASGNEAKGSVPAGAGNVLLRTPGSSSYRPIAAAKVSTISTSGSNKTYAAVADVTAIVAAAGRGTYTVADVQGSLGTNHFAGWSLVVVYGDPTEPVRAMSVFDGLANVASGSPATIDVSGFKTPPTGPVRTALGVVAYEGDLGITGDQFSLNGTPLGNAVRPADNFFNSTITTPTGIFQDKVPNYRNQLGFDTGLIDATGRISNNATSATFRASSTGDQYYPAALTFSTELFSPRYDAVKSVVDIDGGAVRPADILEYTLTLKNDVSIDNGDASINTVISDVLPAGAIYVPGSLEVDGTAVPDTGSVATVSGGTLTVRVGSGASSTSGGRLAIGASVVITYRMQVDAAATGGTVIANDFRVSGTAATSGFSVAGISNEASVRVVADGADLSIIKNAPAVLTAGQIANYTLAVANAGPGSADAVVVTDPLPSGLEFVSAEGTGWACNESGGTLTCDRPALSSGSSAPPITVTVAVPEAASDTGSVVNTATVSSDTPDPDPTNNSSTTTTPIDRSADLAIVKSHEGNAVSGEPITYSIAVRNSGPSVATGVTMSDILPAGLALSDVGGEGWTCTAEISCSLDSPLDPGESAPAIIVVADVLSSAPDPLRNTATVSGNEHDPTPSNNSSTDTATTNRLFDGIESLSHPGKAVAGGAPVPVTVRSFNAGPGDIPSGADAVQTITLPVGTNLDGYSGAGWTCDPETGAASTSPLTVVCRLPLATGWAVNTSLTPLILDVAVAAGETEDKPVEGVLTTTSDVTEIDPANNRALDVITLETSADLALTTSSSASLVAGGPAKELIFSVRNNGPVTDPGPITVRFSRLHDLDLVGAVGSPWACAPIGSTLVCTLTGVSLAQDEVAPDLVLNVRASDPLMLPATVELTGIVRSPQPDPNPANDVATAPIEVTTFADVWTSKTASPSIVAAGDVTTFTLTVSNGAPYGGPSVARDVYLTDDIGVHGLIVESIEPVGGGLDCSASTPVVVSCYTATLNVGAAASVRVVARTDPAWATAGRTLTNVVTASTSTPGDERPPGSATITTNPSSKLSLTKSVRDVDRSSKINPGSNVTYVLSVTSDGPGDAVGATLTDTLPIEVTPSVAVGSGWDCTIVGQQVTCTTSDVLPVGGAIAPVYVTGLLDPDATGKIVNDASVMPNSPGVGGHDQVEIEASDVVDLDVAHFGATEIDAGDDWVTTVSVRNNGPATEPGPIRVEIEQNGATPAKAKGSNWDCTIANRTVTCTTDSRLGLGASLPPIEITSTTSRSGTQANSVAVVSGQAEDSDRTNNRSATSAVLKLKADLAVVKRATSSTVAAGSKATYKVTVTNNGPGATDDAQIVDVLPDGLTFDRADSDARCTNEEGFVQCSAGETLKEGDSTTFRLVAKVPTDLRGSVTNKVTVSSSQPDPDPSNNVDRTTITVTPPVQPQVPLIDPPDRVRDKGETEIYPERPPTNAGQQAKVKVTCQPLLQRVARGDFTYCTVTTRSDGSIWVTVPGTRALRITVTARAKAVTGYSKMKVTYTYTTAKVR